MKLFNTFRIQDPSRSLIARLRYQLGMILRFRRELKSEPVDLVHVKTSSGINFHQNALYAWAARLSGVPVLLQIHSGRFEHFYQESPAPLRAWIRSTLERSGAVAVLSRRWAEIVSALAPGSDVRIVPNGVDEEEMDSLGEGGEIRPSQVFFLGTGRDDLNRDKGLEDILAVVPDLARKHPQSRWVLAGLENPEQTAARLTDARRASDDRERRVVCRGLVDTKEKWDLLRTSAILVLPSYFENMPNILLEAMAGGLGIVGTDVGAVPEMLGYGEGGLLVPPGNRPALASALDRLLGAPALVRAQGRRNRSIAVRDYSMRVVERKLEDLYLEVAGWPIHPGAAAPSPAVIDSGTGRDRTGPVRPVSGA